MKGINKVIVVGNVGRMPDYQVTASGTEICKLSVATNEFIKKQGERTEITEWHRVILFGNLARVANEYCLPGTPVYIEGSNRTRKWQDDSGNDRYITEVICNEFQMLGKAPDDAGGKYHTKQVADSMPSRPQQPAQQPSFDDFDDDIPF